MSKDDDDIFPKDAKIVIAPGALDGLEDSGMTQEEMQEFLDTLKDAIESGEFFENARLMSDEEFQEMVEQGLLPDLGDLDDDSDGWPGNPTVH